MRSCQKRDRKCERAYRGVGKGSRALTGRQLLCPFFLSPLTFNSVKNPLDEDYR